MHPVSIWVRVDQGQKSPTTLLDGRKWEIPALLARILLIVNHTHLVCFIQTTEEK